MKLSLNLEIQDVYFVLGLVPLSIRISLATDLNLRTEDLVLRVAVEKFETKEQFTAYYVSLELDMSRQVHLEKAKLVESVLVHTLEEF